jgi:hypothetical protein
LLWLGSRAHPVVTLLVTAALFSAGSKPNECLQQGYVVVIRATGDWPEHLFEVHEVHDDCVTGQTITGPMKGSYGEPGREFIERVVYRTKSKH